MKTASILITALAASLFCASPAFADSTEVRQTAAGTVIGHTPSKAVGFFGTPPITQPANTLTSRQALQALGLLATGGADPADVFDLTTSNTLGDGTNITLGGTTGTKIGTSATAEKLGFFNATPIVQPHSAAQGALTDSTGGDTSSATLAATAAVTTIAFHVNLVSLTTSAADLITAYTPGYKFKVLAVDFVTTTLGTGTSASQTLNLAIGSTPVTGGVVNPTLSSTATLGAITAGTSVTAANTGTASSTLSVKVAASGTVFTAGTGTLLIKLQNMDTADALARIAVLENALRAGLVPSTGVGLLKGSN